MAVYLYSRVSTSEQTLQQQELEAYQWLNSHKMKVDEVISDEDVSGKISYKNRNLGKILLPKLMPNDILIVSEISRLGRSMYDLNILLHEELKPRKIRLIVVTMKVDLNCYEMRAIDQLILNYFSFAAQIEIELNHDRTFQALQVRKELIKSQGYYINKKGERVTGLGAASESYHRSDISIFESAMKAGNTRNSNTIKSADFQSFCRILKRTFDQLKGTEWDSWKGMKYPLLKSITNTDLLNIFEQMRDAKADNKELFKNYDLSIMDKSILKTIRAKIGNTFSTIETYLNSKDK